MRVLLLVFLVVWFCGATAVGHKFVETNIYAEPTLREGQLRIGLSIADFLLPPLAGVEVTEESISNYRDELVAYFHEENTVKIDDVAVQPVIGAISLESVEDGMHLDMEGRDYQRVNFVLTYLLKQKPEEIDISWAVFPGEPLGLIEDFTDPDQNAQEISFLFDVYGETDYVLFTPEEPRFVWHSEVKTAPSVDVSDVYQPHKKPPLVSIVILVLGGVVVWWVQKTHRVAAVLSGGIAIVAAIIFWKGSSSEINVPDDAKAVRILETLQGNIYRAFDYENEEEVYRALAESVSGDLLDELYAQVYSSLIMKYEGGAVAKVQEVEVFDAVVTRRPSGEEDRGNQFGLTARWRVDGLVQHWGHVHRRRNEYAGNFTLEPIKGRWRISEIEVTSQERQPYKINE